MKLIIKLFVFIFFVSFISCEEVIELNLPDKGARLVVEASINCEINTAGNFQFIKLSSTTPYFDKDKQSQVIGAKVEIVNEDTGDIFNFEDKNNGLYTTDSFKPLLNNNYSLNINYKGEQYQAKEKMYAVPVLDSIKHKKTPFFGGETVEVKGYFKDNANEENYYLGIFTYDNVPKLRLRSDEFSNGNVNSISYRNKELVKDDAVDILFYGVSKNYFNYIRILNSQLGANGGAPFQAPPAKLYGNCKNINKPNEEVLGYFRLSQFVKKKYVLDK